MVLGGLSYMEIIVCVPLYGALDSCFILLISLNSNMHEDSVENYNLMSLKMVGKSEDV